MTWDLVAYQASSSPEKIDSPFLDNLRLPVAHRLGVRPCELPPAYVGMFISVAIVRVLFKQPWHRHFLGTAYHV